MCSFSNKAYEQIVVVQFFAKNKTEDFDLKKPIAIFKPDYPAKLLSAGNYLYGRVTLTNMTRTSTNATLTFHVLKCEDEMDYMCTFYYKDIYGAYFSAEKSPPTRISIQGKNY